MSEQAGLHHPTQRLEFGDVEGFDSLAEHALNMRSSWNHATDQMWRQLDPVLWELTQNPRVVLQAVSVKKLQNVLVDSTFRKHIEIACMAGLAGICLSLCLRTGQLTKRQSAMWLTVCICRSGTQ